MSSSVWPSAREIINLSRDTHPIHLHQAGPGGHCQPTPTRPHIRARLSISRGNAGWVEMTTTGTRIGARTTFLQGECTCRRADSVRGGVLRPNPIPLRVIQPHPRQLRTLFMFFRPFDVSRVVVSMLGAQAPVSSPHPPCSGPGRYCSPRYRMPFNSRNEGSKCVG